MNRQVKVLKEHGLKVTSSRLEILRYLDDHRNHPTAEKVYSGLKKRNPSLSRTTVYNTLDLLQGRGIVTTLTINEKEIRYDLNIEPHEHFLCKGCGIIMDVEQGIHYPTGLLDGLHRIDEVHIYLKGLCNSCLEKGS